MSFARAMELLADAADGWTLVVLDEAGTVTAWGHAAVRLTGQSADEVVGRPFSAVWGSVREVEVLLQRAAADGDAIVGPVRSRRVVDDSPSWTARRITALRDERGHVLGFVAMIAGVDGSGDAVSDRDIMATSLLDTVVHPIFAAGLELNALTGLTTDPEIRRRLATTIDRLDEALRNLRVAVADVRPPVDPL